MKKDFTQPFKTTPTFAHIIVQDDVSKKYVLLRSQEDWEHDFCSVFSLELTDSDIALQFVKYFYERGFDLMSFRELVRRTSVHYSLLDATAGSVNDIVCLHAIVNKTQRTQPVIEDRRLEWVELRNLFSAMQESPYITPEIEVGLAQLYSEECAIDE